MTALPRYMYGDPMIVLMQKQQSLLRRSCNGCTHVIEKVSPFGDEVKVCLKGKPYGKRCRQHEVSNAES